MTIALFAGVRVSDLASARAWYEMLFGDPSFFPNEREVVWMLADDRSVYIEEDPDRAGGGLITLFVDDFEAAIAEVRLRGLEPTERETYSNGVSKATYRDKDGNEIGFGGRRESGASPRRIFLMFDYTSTGLWYAGEDDRPAGSVDPDELPLSDATKQRLEAWVQRVDDLNVRTWAATDEPTPSDAEWADVREEELLLWRALRAEAGPGWTIGRRTTDGIAWDEAE